MVQSIRGILNLLIAATLVLLIGSVMADPKEVVIRGTIVYPKYTMIESLSTSLTLTDLSTKKQMHSSLKKDGTFQIFVDIPVVESYKDTGGVLLLEVCSNAYMIDHPLVQLEVTYENSTEDDTLRAVVRAYGYGLGESIDRKEDEKFELEYPLIMGALKKYNFYEQENKGFLAGTGQLGMMLNNKWIVGGIVVMLVLLAFSYAIEQLDPETVERMKESQQGQKGHMEPLIGSNAVSQPESKTLKKKNQA